MDSSDLLAREDEFRKLNKQLEKKTESLMKEIEHVMQKQDFFSEFSHSLTLSPTHTNIKKHCCDSPKTTTPEKTPTKTKNQLKIRTTKELPKQDCATSNDHKNSQTEHDLYNNCPKNCTGCVKCNNDCAKACLTARLSCDCCTTSRRERINGDLEFLYAFVCVNVSEKILPPSFLKDRATVESVCKFLSSKVKLLQEQIDKLQATINKKASQCEVHLTHQAELESERMTLLNKMNSLKASTTEMKAKYMAQEKKLDEKDRLYKEQRSEADKLTVEVKRLRSKSASVEAKCASQEEVIESLKHQLDTAKRAEKDFRDSTRSLSASHQNTISRLEARVKSLTSCIEKQAALIDNLRRQAALLSTDAAIKALEKEYCNFLTQDF